MGLDIRAITASAAKVGMEVAGNAKTSITLKLGYTAAGNVYDPTTDTTTPSTGGADVTVQALKYKRKISREPNQQVTDRDATVYQHTYLIEAADFTQSIAETDTIVDGGQTFNILAVEQPPGNSVWIVDVMK